MIKQEDLKNTVFNNWGKGEGMFFDITFNYAYNVKTQTFYFHDESTGNLEEPTQITNIDTLKEIYELQPMVNHNFYEK